MNRLYAGEPRFLADDRLLLGAWRFDSYRLYVRFSLSLGERLRWVR